MDEETMLKLTGLAKTMASSSKKFALSIVGLSSTTIALQIAVMALLEEAASDPRRAQHLKAILSRLSEARNVQMLFGPAIDEVAQKAMEQLQALLPVALRVPPEPQP